MTDYTWPENAIPYQVAFFLQPHVGRSESPFTRQQKIYEMSAPRWVARLSVRGGYDNGGGLRNVGGRLDGLIAKLKGGANRVRVYDFRRPAKTGPAVSMQSLNGLTFAFDHGETFDAGEVFLVTYTGGPPSSVAASAGDASITLTGYQHSTAVFYAGDPIGGDGRAHVVTDDAIADTDGNVIVHFQPPLKAAVGAGMVTWDRVWSYFRLASDDAGANMTEVGQVSVYDIELIEDI